MQQTLPAPRRPWTYTLCLLPLFLLLCWYYWPTLHDGLFADDYVAMAIASGQFAGKRAALDLFNFADGTLSDVRALRRLGSLPWWAPDDFRIAFIRPLSSALWYFDRALFGRAYGAYHAHSLLIFFAFVGCVSALYRRLFTPWVALSATLMFAVDDSLHFPVVWLSNRGGIYALLLGVLGLSWHVRFRSGGGRRYAAASSLAIGAGLLFGEWAVPMVAYLFAYELVAATGPLRERALSLVPSTLLCVLFLIARSALGYGARGSGAYIDPGADPLRFVLSLGHRVPVFFGDMVWNIPAEWWDHGTPWRDQLLQMWLFPPRLWMQLPSWHAVQLGLGWLGMAALGGLLYVCWRGLSDLEKKHLAFLSLGALGSLAPVVGSFPSTRLTIASFFGLAPVFAVALRQCARSLRALPWALSRRTLVGIAAWGAMVFAIVHLQIYSPLQGDVQAQVDHYATTSQWVQAAELDPERVAHQRVFLLAGAEFTTTFFFSYILAHGGRPLPRSYHPITCTPRAHYIQRTAPNELLLRALGGSYLESGAENMFQSPARRWREGETVELDELSVRVEQVADGLPAALRLRFARDLDDPSYVFLVAAPHGLVRAPLPPLGVQWLLARAASPSWTNLERHRDYIRIAPLPETQLFAPFPGFMAYRPR